MAPQNTQINETESCSCSQDTDSCNTDALVVRPNGAEAVDFKGNCPSKYRLSKCSSGAIRLTDVKAAKQWPVKLRLVPEQADFFDEAKLLLAADCAAYMYAPLYKEFIHGRTVLISCPKFDDFEYSKKLSEILRNNNIRSLIIVRMDTPCCARLEQAAIEALNDSGKFIPWQVVRISTDGEIAEQR